MAGGWCNSGFSHQSLSETLGHIYKRGLCRKPLWPIVLWFYIFKRKPILSVRPLSLSLKVFVLFVKYLFFLYNIAGVLNFKPRQLSTSTYWCCCDDVTRWGYTQVDSYCIMGGVCRFLKRLYRRNSSVAYNSNNLRVIGPNATRCCWPEHRSR